MAVIPDKPRKVTREELKAIVDSEIQSALGELTGDLSKDRSTSMERYLGAPDGREMEGRSQVQARDVLDVIEWIMPSLLRVFATQRAVEVDPVGPEDEKQADQETDYLRHLFFKKNQGFMILYEWFKDALLQKNGIAKIYIEEAEESRRETYYGLTDEEYAALVADPDAEVVAYTGSVGNDGLTAHNVTILHTESTPQIRIEIVPPEEFLISRDARSVYPHEARFCAHQTDVTVSDLMEQGYSWDTIITMEFGLSGADWSEESVQRYNLSDEQRWTEVEHVNTSMQTIRMTECYIKADMNGDGIAELVKVLRSGDFIEWEEIEDHPFCAVTPIPLTHKFIGLSVADLMMDLQDIRTGLLRAYLDNVHQIINGETYYDENTVDVEDMLTSRPYGRYAVDGPPGDKILKVPNSGLPAEAFSLEEIVDKLRRERIGDFTSQLDPTVLSQANNGVVIEMIQEAKAKIEMIARVFAETGVRELFRRMHTLSRKHSQREEIVRLKGDWMPVNPGEWRERKDFTVRVGLGTRSRQENLANIEAIHNHQMRLLTESPYGPMLVPPDRLYNSAKEFAEEIGEPMGDKFFQHPSQFQPPPPQPDPNMLMIQSNERIEQMKAQLKAEELRVKSFEVQSDVDIERMKAELAARDQMGKSQLERLKAEMAMLKQAADGSSAETKAMMDVRVKDMETSIKGLDIALRQRSEDNRLALEQYKAELASATQLTTAAMSAGGNGAAVPPGEDGGEAPSAPDIGKLMASLVDAIAEVRDELQAPKEFVRDEKTGAILKVGNKAVRYDDNGRIAGIG